MTCLECGKEIYGLVLRQAAMEGWEKKRKLKMQRGSKLTELHKSC